MPSVKSMPKGAKDNKTTASTMPSKKHLEPHTLSTEYIQESDSEDEETSDTNSTSDNDSLPENPASRMLKKNSKTNTQVNQNNSSSDSEDESGSGSGDESSGQQSKEDQVPRRTENAKQTVGPDRQR